MKKKIAFATTLCDKYVTGALITLNSLLETTENFHHDVIVFEWGELSEDNKKTLKQLYNKIIFKKVDTESYSKQLHSDIWRTWTYNCNYRFDIFTLTDYDRVVFFDCDILFEIDINELLSYEVDFGACIMPYDFFFDYQTYNPDSFNAGLMSISKKYLTNKTKLELIKIANSSPKLWSATTADNWFGNQPILNNFFFEKMTALPEKFNFLIDRLSPPSFLSKKNYHFIGLKKPWFKNNGYLNDKYDECIFKSISTNETTQTMLLYKLTQKSDAQLEKLKAKKIIL